MHVFDHTNISVYAILYTHQAHNFMLSKCMLPCIVILPAQLSGKLGNMGSDTVGSAK